MCVPYNIKSLNVEYVFCVLKVNFPDMAELKGSLREQKMIYRFDYLPPGLFNRVQVRLAQFSDKNCIWKRGSLLNKSGQKALLSMRGYIILIYSIFQIRFVFSNIQYKM